MNARERFNVYLPTRLKRRLKAISEDKDMPMNDIVISAINDAIDRIDEDHSSPDLVAERMSEVLTSQIRLVSTVNTLSERVADLTAELESRDN